MTDVWISHPGIYWGGGHLDPSLRDSSCSCWLSSRTLQVSQLPAPRPSPGLIPQLRLTSWHLAGEGELTRWGPQSERRRGPPAVSFHPNNSKSQSSGATPNLTGRIPQHSHSLSGLHLPISNQPWACQPIATLCLPQTTWPS